MVSLFRCITISVLVFNSLLLTTPDISMTESISLNFELIVIKSYFLSQPTILSLPLLIIQISGCKLWCFLLIQKEYIVSNTLLFSLICFLYLISSNPFSNNHFSTACMLTFFSESAPSIKILSIPFARSKSNSP